MINYIPKSPQKNEMDCLIKRLRNLNYELLKAIKINL